MATLGLNSRRGFAHIMALVPLLWSATKASRSLAALRNTRTLESGRDFVSNVSTIISHIAKLNAAYNDVRFYIEAGPIVAGLAYDRSAALVQYASRSSLLRSSIERSLNPRILEADMVALSVTSTFDFLTAIIIADVIRQERPAAYLVLFDHGYENFTLAPHINELKKNGCLLTVFDAVIESKDEKTDVFPALVDEVRAGRYPRGFLRSTDVPKWSPKPGKVNVEGLRSQPYAPESVLWTRVSPRRCYWNRCAFCVQNVKFDDKQAPSISEIDAALDRIEIFANAGFRTFIFSDEALSPHFLEEFCDKLYARKLQIRWCCRCKIERSFTPSLFKLMRESGCFEVLFGIESISETMLKRMDKYTPGLDPEKTAEIFKWLSDAGIGAHVNLIAGFPGDTPSEVLQSVEWTIRAARSMDNTTYLLNDFALFSDTPIARNAASFGIAPAISDADVSQVLGFDVSDPRMREELMAVRLMIPTMQARLSDELGWSRIVGGEGAQTAKALYFSSGLGALMKASDSNPFRNPLVAEWIHA